MHKIYYDIVQIIFMNVTINVRRKMAIIYEIYSKVSIPKPQTQYRKNFQYNGRLISNSIPKEIRLTSTLNIFKIKIKGLPSLFNKCNI